MHTEPLDVLPLWGLAVMAAALLWLALEAGYRAGQWRHSQAPGEKDQAVGAMVASILGLLALVLGFTFSLSASRFEARRQVVLEESNAIGTAYLRARLLPQPQQTEVARLLEEYADVRVRRLQEGKVEEVIFRSEFLHEQLWNEASAAAEQNPNSIMTGVFIQSLNEVIDLHAKRVLVGVRSRIPIVIWAGLYVLSLLGVSCVGYTSGLTVARRSPVMLAVVIAFSLVLYLIADLDRGQEGLLRVSQQAMVDVQRSMQTTLP